MPHRTMSTHNKSNHVVTAHNSTTAAALQVLAFVTVTVILCVSGAQQDIQSRPHFHVPMQKSNTPYRVSYSSYMQ